MSTLGLVSTAAQNTSASPVAPPALQVRLEDSLASPRRLWLRGRVLGIAPAPSQPEAIRPWWSSWWPRASKLDVGRVSNPPGRIENPSYSNGTSPLMLHLVTKISGSVLETDVPLDAHGRFEAQFEVTLPPARRGWRVARNHITLGERHCDVCSLVVTPPEGASGVLAVVLPPELTQQPGTWQAPVNAGILAELGQQLRTWEQAAKGWQQVYYLACVPADSDSRATEMALAANNLGWPAGTFVLLPTDRSAVALEEGVARLRWLFDGLFNVQVLPQRTEVRSQKSEVRSQKSANGSLLVSVQRPARARLLPRYPVVFCHGMLAFSMLKMSIPEDCNCFAPMREYMRERGFRALYPQVAPTSGVIERAAQLREQILRWTDEPVNIVAHSMGGLDARYMISRLDMGGRVKSLTTISTPHRGTYLAEWILATYHQQVPLLLALESFGVNIDGFRDCRPSACAAFNANTPDHPDVRYFSYGASVALARLTPVLRRAWNILRSVEGDNDGMVSVASARWGQYLGTIHADHYAQTPDLTFIRPGEDFDVLGFYARLVEDLARRGF